LRKANLDSEKDMRSRSPVSSSFSSQSRDWFQITVRCRCFILTEKCALLWCLHEYVKLFIYDAESVILRSRKNAHN